MKASKFADAQKALTVKQGNEDTTVAEICRKARISPATYFTSEMRRLRDREDEHNRLKRIVTDHAR